MQHSSYMPIRAALAAIALGLAPLALAAQATLLHLTPEQIRIAEIRTARAEAALAGPDSAGVSLPGRVVPRGDVAASIVSTVPGRIEAILVQVGAAVAAGQPLLRLRSPELAALERQYLQARTVAELAGKRAERDASLHADGLVSQARLAESRAAQESAVASEREQMRALLLAGYREPELASLNPRAVSGELVLRAHGRGVVTEQPLHVGDYAGAGTLLLGMASLEGWWLELQASAEQAGTVRVGDAVRLPGCAAAGRIIAVSSQLDPRNQTVLVRAELPGTAGCVRGNQYVTARVMIGSPAEASVVIPGSALVRSGTTDFVFVQEGVQFRPVRVEVARRDDERAWIRSGIPAGVAVAVSGTSALKGAWLGMGATAGEAR